MNMSGEAFRPRKINPNDIAGSPIPQDAPPPARQRPEPVDFNQVAAAHEAMGNPMPADPDMPRDKGPVSDFTSPSKLIANNMPPEIAKMMKEGAKTLAGEQGQNYQPATPQRGPQQQRPMMTNNASSGGDVVKEMLASIKQFTTNYEEITLPSLGKFYNGNDGPINGVLNIRPMTGQEEKIIATPRFIKKGQAVNMIFKNCMLEKFDPDQFLSVDREYLLIYLRGISYSPDYEVTVRCSECQTSFNHVINLDTLFMSYCPDEFTAESLVDVFPKTGFKFTYRLARGRDESAIINHRERRIKDWGDATHDDTLLFRASSLIEQMETPSGGILTGQHNIIGILEQLPIQDVAYIRNLLTDPPFGVDKTINLNCPSCIRDFQTELPLESNFFFPRTRKKMVEPR